MKTYQMPHGWFAEDEAAKLRVGPFATEREARERFGLHVNALDMLRALENISLISERVRCLMLQESQP